MEIKAYAKVNLTLDVLGERPDGYHELRGIMRSVSLCDKVTVLPAGGIAVGSDAALPFANTARRAAELFLEKTGRGAHIFIEKRIPSLAGLGGGSADGAAVLRGMNRIYGSPLSERELYALGLRVGADVPFCLLGGCALAEGVGEILTPLPDMDMGLLIVKGGGGISTGELFRRLRPPQAHPDTQGAIDALREGDFAGLCARCRNALEGTAAEMLPEIAEHKRRLLEAGAAAAFMTGSGSCVVGLFPDGSGAARAEKRFGDAAFARACR